VKVCSLLEGEFFRVLHHLRNTFVVDICPTFRLPQSEMCALLLSFPIDSVLFLFIRHFIVTEFLFCILPSLYLSQTQFVFFNLRSLHLSQKQFLFFNLPSLHLSQKQFVFFNPPYFHLLQTHILFFIVQSL
jgi:hypothetical protein